jgi:TRAP transporter 4TM/12TM fusion protein
LARVLREKTLNIMVAATAIILALYHMANVYFSIAGTIQHRMIHLVLALLLIFFSAAKDGKRSWPYLLLALATVLTVGYLWINLESLLFNQGFPQTPDVVAGFAIVFIVLLACWRSFGYILPLMAVLLLCYGFFGHYLGGPILSVGEVITTVALTFGSYDLWGNILIISANIIFMFVLFGGMLGGLGANGFFLELGKLVGHHSRSGPAMTAVVASALMGTTTGQATPNIAVTGAFTIPLMKKVGYRPAVAASVEAAASGGAQIMPPIMGAGAFVMADLLGTTYGEIILAALLPALLYFFSVGLFVHFQALKSNVALVREQPDRRKLVCFAPLFVVPLGVILTLLFFGYPEMFAAFWGIVSLLAISYLNPVTRPAWQQVREGCVKGALTGAKVAVACATLGPIIALVTKTGLGLTIGYSVEAWSHGSLFLALIICMGCVIIFGLEVPTVAAYLLAYMVAIPALQRLGLEPIQAHMFAFYFGAFSALTPPVGMGAIVASRIAGAPYVRTAWHSMAAAGAGFLIPFVFAYNGSLLLAPGYSVMDAALAVLLTMAGLVIFQVGFVGYFVAELKTAERVLSVLSGLGFMAFAALGNYFVLLPSALVLCSVLLLNLRRNRLAAQTASAA